MPSTSKQSNVNFSDSAHQISRNGELLYKIPRKIESMKYSANYPNDFLHSRRVFETGLSPVYAVFPDRFCTKRNSVWCQITSEKFNYKTNLD